MCPKCKGRGHANGYYAGRVLRGICDCPSGKAYEKKQDALKRSLGLNPDLCKRYLKDARKH